MIGRPYLLPVAWIYRIIRAVKEKKSFANRIERVNVDGEQVKDYVDMLEKWGAITSVNIGDKDVDN